MLPPVLMQKHTHHSITVHTCANRAMGNIYNTASTARRASLWFCVRRLEKKRLLTPLPGLPLMTGVCVCRANYSSRSLAVSVRKTAALGPRRDGATIDRSPPASQRGHVQAHARGFFQLFLRATGRPSARGHLPLPDQPGLFQLE